MFVPSTGFLERFIRRLSAPLILLMLVTETSVSAENLAQDIEVSVRVGCPHCEAAGMFSTPFRLSDLRFESRSLT